MISVSKGICIILMVIGHSGCPTFLHDFIYLFHMPFFFFISGWFCKQSTSLCGKGGLSIKILKRIKRLYIPFVLYCLAFIALSVISTACTGTDYLGVKEISVPLVIKVLVNMEAPTDLLGATWFIRSLFFAAVSIDILLFISRKIRHSELYLLAIFLVTAVWMKTFPADTPVIRQLALIVFGGAFFLLGCSFRKMFEKMMGYILALPVCIILLVLETVFIPNTMLKVNGAWDSILYFIGAIPGILLMLIISSYVNRLKSTGRILSYIGINTRIILFLHFTAFIAINLLAVVLKDLDGSLITSFPVIHSLKGCWWILYTLAGTLVPLLLKFISTKLRPMKS